MKKSLITLSLSTLLIGGTGGFFLGNYVSFDNENQKEIQQPSKEYKKFKRSMKEIEQNEKEEVENHIILKNKDIDVETNKYGVPMFIVTYDYEIPEGSMLNSEEDVVYEFGRHSGMRSSWWSWSESPKNNLIDKEFFINPEFKKGEVKIAFSDEEDAKIDASLYEYWRSLFNSFEQAKKEKQALENLKKKYNDDNE